MIERVFILKRTEVFGDLGEDILTSLSTYLDEAHYDAGDTIFKKGDVGRTLYIVVDGSVRIHDDDGTTIGTIGEDEIFGERSALTGNLHRASATAATDCKILKLDEDLLYEVMTGHPEVAQGLIEVLLERFK